MQAIILSAGLGSRMKTSIPKCAYPILKKPMIEYLVDSLERAKVKKIITVVGYQKEVFEEMLKGRVQFAYQEKLDGTAKAVSCALNFLDLENTLIIPGDTPLLSSMMITEMFNYHKENKNDMTILTTRSKKSGYGRIIKDDKGLVKAIVEEKEATKDELSIDLINTGIYIIKTELLKKYVNEIKNDNNSKEYYLTDIVSLLSGHKVDSYYTNDTYMVEGINDLYNLSLIESKLIEKINKKHMLNGVNIINPRTTVIGIDVQIGPNVTIYPNCMITGKTIIDYGAQIGPNCELDNAIIEKNAQVKHSVITDSKICENAVIGPFSHVRCNTIVGPYNRIGNYVEVKNSTLDKNTKAAHLTYIGDTKCGSNVNFGCGTVTVNYDGKNKYETVIGSNVFIGCNTNLIAPVEIEDNAYIAAGSTITDKVENGDFVIARVPQTNKKGYAIKWKKDKFGK